MDTAANLIFKIATEEDEFAQIHRLNYDTFAEEIPQHAENPQKMLVDRFHGQNTYLICMKDRLLIGMLCVRDQRPFSLEEKMANLYTYISPAEHLCEIRLLSVRKGYRSGQIFFGLMTALSDYCHSKQYTLALISGTTRQQKLYHHLGFIPFGDLIGEKGAQFQPMSINFSDFQHSTKKIISKVCNLAKMRSEINFLTGPVKIDPSVKKQLRQAPISHRSDVFMADLHDLQRKLCRLVNAQYVQLLVGSGTLANEVVAGQISLNAEHGLILSNGEFGERLLSQAERWGLSFITLKKNWGEGFTPGEIAAVLEENPQIGWLWTVHCETSTGLLTDIAMLKALCQGENIKICLDCTSSIAAVPIDLQSVYLASGVSGKAFGSFAGIGMVFSNHLPAVDKKLPSYFDLGYYHQKEGVPFTVSSNLIYALNAAVDKFLSNDRVFERIAENSLLLREILIDWGVPILNRFEESSPAVLTIALPQEMKSTIIGDYLTGVNCLVNYRSSYLQQRNWIQFYLTGNTSRDDLLNLAQLLQEYAKVPSLTASGANA